MSRLPRPPIPLAVQLNAALRQLSPGINPEAVAIHVAAMKRARRLGVRLAQVKESIARGFGCEVSDLRLDHTLALENRTKVFVSNVHVDYDPPANDPGWLGYRPHGAEFDGSHDVKTRIRGDRGQLSDNALAKKERRRLRPCARCRQHDRLPGRRLCKRCHKVAEKFAAKRKTLWPKGRKLRGRPFSKKVCR